MEEGAITHIWMHVGGRIGVNDILGVERRREAMEWILEMDRLNREYKEKKRERECESE